YFGDDWGQQKNMIMGPEYWRDYIKPRLKRMYKRVKDKGLYVIQHSCGDIEPVFDDLVEIGLDCYQTFQPEIYDIEKIKDIYTGKLAFWGGISTQQLLSRASADEVKKETARIMKILFKNGGYIASSTHAIEFDVPAENILAMYDVFTNQDKYL
ncbi:MAG: uroporphyrinogen decarboxylase family protein, partial [Clostridia bacterium]|nr:uroporphyrinogen decarboxylase family protein [Clostridia bacterium]